MPFYIRMPWRVRWEFIKDIFLGKVNMVNQEVTIVNGKTTFEEVTLRYRHGQN